MPAEDDVKDCRRFVTPFAVGDSSLGHTGPMNTPKLTTEDRRIVYRSRFLAVTAWSLYGADTDREYAAMLRRMRSRQLVLCRADGLG